MSEVVENAAEEVALIELERKSRLFDNGQEIIHMTEVNETELPVNAGQQYIYSSLECGRRVPEAEWHALEAIGSHVGHKRGLVSVSFGDRDLPIPAVGV